MKVNNYIQNINKFNEIQKKNLEEDTKNQSFLSTLQEKLDEVNTKQIEAEKVTEKFIKGEEGDIHNVMLSTEEAKMSLELAVQIRNKIVEAYEEINRMQI